MMTLVLKPRLYFVWFWKIRGLLEAWLAPDDLVHACCNVPCPTDLALLTSGEGDKVL
jgi:hypothetical protein